MKKRRIRIALVILGAALLWCTAAMAAHSGKYGSLSWSLDNQGTLKITGTGVMNNVAVNPAGSWLPYRSEIKKVIIGEGITAIGDGAFVECEEIQSISVPESVKQIGTQAFCWCSALTDITLPEAVTVIPTEAFYHCTSLKNLILPKNITTIGEGAFSWCSALTEIEIPRGVTSLPRDAFYCCESLTGITLPDGITSIGDSAFHNCSSLSAITFPESLLSIGEGAFFYCTSLRNVVFPKKMDSIGKAAFYNCNKMSGIIIPDGLTQIEAETFGACASLTSVVIPESVTFIGKKAFIICDGMTDITLPDSVISLGDDAFSGCTATIYAHTDTEIARLLGKAGFSFRDPDKNYSLKFLYDGDRIIGSEISRVDPEIVSFSFPEGIVSIANNAFRCCSLLENLVVPDGVTSIGYSAFESCVSLKSIVLPDSVTWIGDSAFFECTNLKSVNLPTGITEIEMFTFCKCTSLESIVLPDSVTWIGDSAFSECTNLKSVNLPTGITEIGQLAFYKCLSLTDLVIPGSVNTVDYWAFGDCSGLRSVVLQEGVNVIGESAFIRSGLRSVILPGSLTSIGKMAFRSCSGLTSVTVPAGVTSIGSQAFYFVDSLKKVVFLGNEITFGDEIFTSVPTVYCHQNSGVEGWALGMGFTVVPLEGFSPDAERSVLLKDETLFLDIGQSARVIPVIFPDYDHPEVIWTSSDPSVASVTDGIVEAVRYGKCTVTATVGAASTSIEVDVHRLARSISFPQEELWVYYQDVLQLTPVIEPLDAETMLTWSAPYEYYAGVDESGRVFFRAATDLAVTVSTETGLSATVLVHGCTRVTDVRLSDYAITMPAGETRQLDAYVTMDSASCVNQFVTFSSSDENIASVDSHGRITALCRGQTTIWVYCEDLAKYFWCDITVVNPITSILTLPANLRVIGPEAFANLDAGYGFIIPETVTYIADDAFLNTQATIIAPADSYAALWAENHPEVDWMTSASLAK